MHLLIFKIFDLILHSKNMGVQNMIFDERMKIYSISEITGFAGIICFSFNRLYRIRGTALIYL